MSNIPRVGLVGAGIMGRPLGRNLLRAGYGLTAYDLDPSAVQDLVAAGALAVSSPSEVAAETEIFISMLPDSAEVREVYAGPKGAFEALRPGWLAMAEALVLAHVLRWFMV
jgi:3-hydroxyisobutyrate dehydrogenase-like beta-hydroxyacid dehydrogenase